MIGCTVLHCGGKVVATVRYTWVPPWMEGERLDGRSDLCDRHAAMWARAGLLDQQVAERVGAVRTAIPEEAAGVLESLRQVVASAEIMASVREAYGMPAEEGDRVFTHGSLYDHDESEEQ